MGFDFNKNCHSGLVLIRFHPDIVFRCAHVARQFDFICPSHRNDLHFWCIFISLEILKSYHWCQYICLLLLNPDIIKNSLRETIRHRIRYYARLLYLLKSALLHNDYLNLNLWFLFCFPQKRSMKLTHSSTIKCFFSSYCNGFRVIARRPNECIFFKYLWHDTTQEIVPVHYHIRLNCTFWIIKMCI